MPGFNRHVLCCTLVKAGLLDYHEVGSSDTTIANKLASDFQLSVTINRTSGSNIISRIDEEIKIRSTIRGNCKSYAVEYLTTCNNLCILLCSRIYNSTDEFYDMTEQFEAVLGLPVKRSVKEHLPSRIWYEMLVDNYPNLEVFDEKSTELYDHLEGFGIEYDIKNRSLLVFSILRVEFDPYASLYHLFTEEEHLLLYTLERRIYADNPDPVDAFMTVAYELYNNELPENFQALCIPLFTAYNEFITR